VEVGYKVVSRCREQGWEAGGAQLGKQDCASLHRAPNDLEGLDMGGVEIHTSWTCSGWDNASRDAGSVMGAGVLETDNMVAGRVGVRARSGAQVQVQLFKTAVTASRTEGTVGW
jgi:hypothetical protein